MRAKILGSVWTGVLVDMIFISAKDDYILGIPRLGSKKYYVTFRFKHLELLP